MISRVVLGKIACQKIFLGWDPFMSKVTKICFTEKLGKEIQDVTNVEVI